MREYIQGDKWNLYCMVAPLFTDIVWLSSKHGLVMEKDLTRDLLNIDNPVGKFWYNESPEGNTLDLVFYVEQPVWYK